MEEASTDESGWFVGSEDETNTTDGNYLAPEALPKEVLSSKMLEKTASGSSISKKTSGNNLKGITSSPSFQELEKAIGQELNSSSDDGSEGKGYAGGASISSSRWSGTNLTQQKLNQQRIRQQQQYYQQPGYRNQQFYANKANMSGGFIISSRNELQSFLNESESRALILFHSTSFSSNTIREACSKFGVLYYIRPEFQGKGVTFLSYFDLQAAIAAKEGLIDTLGADAEAGVYYSVMLHATTSNTEEFKLLVRNLPQDSNETNVQEIFARYGQLKSIQKTFGSTSDLASASTNSSLPVAYTVEYCNIQDARLAASELSATSGTIWGPDVIVKFAPLDERKQSLCKQLLSTLSRWRSEMASQLQMQQQAPNMQMQLGNQQQHIMPHLVPANIPPMLFSVGGVVPGPGGGAVYQLSRQRPQQLQSPQHQLQLRNNMAMMTTNMNNMNMNGMNMANGNGGMYFPSYGPAGMTLPMPLPPAPRSLHTMQQQQQQQQQFLPQQQMYQQQQQSGDSFNRGSGAGGVPERKEYRNDGSMMQSQQQMQQQQYSLGASISNGGYAANDGKYNVFNSFILIMCFLFFIIGSRRVRTKDQQGGSSSGGGGGGGGSDLDYALNMTRLLDGSERRTTLMVRNIPNKYNQQMLLEEVNIKHAGTYDFFYLPIDFKNKCNVGYCFVNFLDTSYIPAFVESFHGHRWRSFNSEKVCAVTFARIQGKQAMIARFQNSSLLEKDDEYKPLLFYSQGPDIGQPEPFPVNLAKSNNNNPRQGHYAGGGGSSSGQEDFGYNNDM